LLILALLWLPLALPLALLIRDPDWRSIVTLSILYLEFIGLVRYWGKVVHQQPQILQHYGLYWTAGDVQRLLLNFCIGFAALALLYAFYVRQGWGLGHATVQLGWIALEGLAIALAVGFAEELLFRGWLLAELTHDYGDRWALGATSAIFAGVHAPLYQFPGLFLLGAALVWAKRGGQQRLSSAIGLHAGFVWGYYLIQVGQLITLTDTAPAWAVGLGRNPLASVPGLICLSVLVVSYRGFARKLDQS
jgi:hypothetical protein